MTDKEKIKSIIELFIAWNGETEAIDVANLDSAVDFIADSLQEESVSEVWHDVTEKPNTKRFVVLTKDGMITTAFIPLKMSFGELAERARIKKWAYLDDLVNLSNVERTVKNSQEPVSDDLEKTAEKAAADAFFVSPQWTAVGKELFKAGAEWGKKHLWRDAQGDDLPKINREVIALLNNGKVIFAHRPYKRKYIGKNLITGNIKTFENEAYGEGGWNIPDIKWWLDVELPKEIEL